MINRIYRFSFEADFSPRTVFNQALGTPDNGALRNLYNETVCMAFPEAIKDTLKSDFYKRFQNPNHQDLSVTT